MRVGSGKTLKMMGRRLLNLVHLKPSIMEATAQKDCLAHAVLIAIPKITEDPNYKAYIEGRKIAPKVQQLLTIQQLPPPYLCHVMTKVTIPPRSYLNTLVTITFTSNQMHFTVKCIWLDVKVIEQKCTEFMALKLLSQLVVTHIPLLHNSTLKTLLHVVLSTNLHGGGDFIINYTSAGIARQH
jgi:hypothetical protein